MKVIQVSGYSGSGKTTFIRGLIPLLKKQGSVAVIKHLGHHSFALDETKDTTLFFSGGADVSVGADGEKTVYIEGYQPLENTLGHLCDRGISYTIVEGFKSVDLPKIVIGDFESVRCVLRNPGVHEVLSRISDFPDVFTLGGMLKEIYLNQPSSRGMPHLSYQGKIETESSGKSDDLIVHEILEAIHRRRDVIARVRIQRNLFSGPDLILIVVCARYSDEGAEAMKSGLGVSKKLGVQEIPEKGEYR
jgi:molybdopterin synthase catalytic subunit